MAGSSEEKTRMIVFFIKQNVLKIYFYFKLDGQTKEILKN